MSKQMSQDDMMRKTDDAISELVYNKYELQKAYNYYLGHRDKKQFEYLENNYGIGNPTSVTFTPLVKKHFDALVGEFLGTPIIPKVSCKDSETVSNITRDRDLEIAGALMKYLNEKLSNSLLQIISGKDVTDKQVKAQMDKIVDDINMGFVSKYEIAAQNVIDYVMQSRQTDMTTKHRQLLLDLLITGTPYFRVGESKSGTNIEIEVLDPLNTFVERNPNSVYVKDSYRAVVRKWMTREEIIERYGDELGKSDIDLIKEGMDDVSDWGQYMTGSRDTYPIPEGLQQPLDDPLPGHPDTKYTSNRMRFIPVYEVEWLETDAQNVMQRYSSVRIGEELYILNGIDERALRSKDDPKKTCLKVNGVIFYNRSNKPFSLMLSCMDIQDKYDLLLFYRDNLIASSGGVGDWMDLSLLPSYLGKDPNERMQKWVAYKKAGLGMLDSAQEGRNNTGGGNLNTIFNGYDNTVKQDAVAAIQLAINSLEDTLSSITGVFQERLNGIEQRDAVTNVKQSVTNSFIITKQYYQQMDLLTSEMLTACLNQAKVTWKAGVTGMIVLGDGQHRVFTALPEEFTVTDYDVHVVSTTEILQDMQQIWTIVPQLISSGQFPADMLVDVMTSKSLTDIRQKVRKGIRKQKEENDQVKELTEQLEQAQQNGQKLSEQLDETKAQLDSLNKEKIEIEKEKMQLQYKVDWYKAQTDRQYKSDKIDIDKKLADIEVKQMWDANAYNNVIRKPSEFD